MYNREKTKEAEEILERITTELNRQGKTQKELIDFLDLANGVYSSWKAGRSRNFCEHLGEISRFLGVNAEYLVTGSISEKIVENEREQQLLECYRKLSADKQDAVMQNMKWLAEK